jgi:hypothetical protein
MTAQRCDTIFIDGTEHKLYSLPLNQYWEKHQKTIYPLGSNTALTRGYYATWLLEDDKLYLIDFWGENFMSREEYSLADLFPGQDKIFAEWFTGELTVPVGNEIKYFHAGNGSIHEYEAKIKIQNGILIETAFKDNNKFN